jgi:xanthosine utilization system XapX-like protein
VIRVNKTLGTILIALGLVGLLWGGITYTTTEKILDIGPIEASRDESHTIPLPPLAGAAALIGGIVLLVSGKKA